MKLLGLNDLGLYLSGFNQKPKQELDYYGSMTPLLDNVAPLMSPASSPKREETQSSGYISNTQNFSESSETKERVVFQLPYNSEMPPKKRVSAIDPNEKYDPRSADDLNKFLEKYSSGNAEGKKELKLILSRLQNELSQTERKQKITLLMHYELYLLTYLFIKDFGTFYLTNCQHNVIKKIRSTIDDKGLFCGDELSERWDYLMDKHYNQLKETLLNSKGKREIDKHKKFFRRMLALLSFSRNQFAICHTDSVQDFLGEESVEVLSCSVTGNEIKNQDKFNIYRFCYVDNETLPSQTLPNLNTKREYIVINTHSISYINLNGIENTLIKLMKSIIAFLNYRAIAIKKINIWKEDQKFTSQEPVQKKVELFQQDKEFLFQCVFDFALLFNNFYTFLNFLKE
jgi:hypothetical protein